MKCDTQDWGREGTQSVRAFSLVFLFNVEGWLPPGGISALSKCSSHGQNSFVSDCSQAPQPHPEKWSHRVPQSCGEDVSYLPPYFSIKFTERCLGPLLRLVKWAPSQARGTESEPGTIYTAPRSGQSLHHRSFCRGSALPLPVCSSAPPSSSSARTCDGPVSLWPAALGDCLQNGSAAQPQL